MFEVVGISVSQLDCPSRSLARDQWLACPLLVWRMNPPRNSSLSREPSRIPSHRPSSWSDQALLTWKILLLHCWTIPNIIEVRASSVTWSSKFTLEITTTASDISVANVSITWNVRFRNSLMKSSNFAVDRHTSFSTFWKQQHPICMRRWRFPYLSEIVARVERRGTIDACDQHEHGVEKLESDGSLLEIVGIDAGQYGHEERKDIGLSLREVRCLPNDLTCNAR